MIEPSEMHINAVYSPQLIARFQGNPLIEALPSLPTEEQLLQVLSKRPDFSPEQREWPTSERLNQVMSLGDFSVPLARHIQLAYTLDSMIRQGYVSRAPRTPAHIQLLQKIYKNQKAGVAFTSSTGAKAAALSTSLVGVSGMGKTTTLHRLEHFYPEVIYHPDLHLWQIPILHVETPHDGASVKGLANSILRQVDKLIPDANYYELYAMNTRASVETMMNHVARILHLHCVGLLIFDEIQNLENAPKNKQALMTLLVSASNELGVPIVFVGTNKARRVLSLDFRQARRSIGQGLAYWDRLEQSAPNEDSEWNSFLEVLWKFQWLRSPVALNSFLADLMYHHTQGVIDLTIKLFAACQWRAMLDGSEKITAQLIENVAGKELKLIQPMVEALRHNDLKALESYDDIAPINMESILNIARSKMEGKRVLGAGIRPGNPLFEGSVSTALTALGIDAEYADAVASSVEAYGNVTNVLDGVTKAIEHVMPPKRVKSSAKTLMPLAQPLAPADLRNAVQLATSQRTSIFTQLQQMGAVCDIRSVLHL